MKLHIIQTGFTKVPYGQFFGGLDGWSGLKGKFKFATDKSHYILVPVNCFLIEHPSEGPILIDTGINLAQAKNHKTYYTGITGIITDEDEYLMNPEEEITSQLESIGYKCSDVNKIILTHLHEDHVGGLKYFPHSKIFISSDEWLLKDKKILGLIPQVYPKSLSMITSVETIKYSSGPFYNFPRSQDIFNDGSIIMLPTPGHSIGHSSIFIQFGDYQVLLCGDSLYTLRHLAVDQVMSIIIDAKLTANYIDSIRLTQELKKNLPNLVIIPGHDPTPYHNEYLKPYFNTGSLSTEELFEIKKYEKNLFKDEYHLFESCIPEFSPNPNKKNIGSIK
jgi:glyoxylase-like metal-dependent hydrolase (beta-lactamase superfamily II)